MSFKGFSIFSSGGTKGHSNEIISKSIHRFMRRCDLSKLLMTDETRQTLGDHKSSP